MDGAHDVVPAGQDPTHRSGHPKWGLVESCVSSSGCLSSAQTNVASAWGACSASGASGSVCGTGSASS